MLQASQSFQPLLSSSAEQAQAPCPACAGTGQAPRPRTQSLLPRLPKRPRFPANLVLQTHTHIYTYIYTCMHVWLGHRGRQAPRPPPLLCRTAGACGFADDRWCPQRTGTGALSPASGTQRAPIHSTELTWMALRVPGKTGGFGCPWRLAEVWVCSRATFARSRLHIPSLHKELIPL